MPFADPCWFGCRLLKQLGGIPLYSQSLLGIIMSAIISIEDC